MERAGYSAEAFFSYWSKPVVIFTNIQRKGSTIVQEQWLLNLREVRGAFNYVCASLHLRNDVPDLQKNWVENNSAEESRKCGDIARKQSTFLLWKWRTFKNEQTEDEKKTAESYFITQNIYTLVIIILCVWSRLGSMITLTFRHRASSI